MDIWRATNKQINDTAEYIYGQKAKTIYRPSGLWADVTLEDDRTAIVNDYQIDMYLQSIFNKKSRA